LSWPDGDLELVKHRAESIALNALPPDPAMMVRSARDNATSHPMGHPLNRPLTSFDVLGAGSFAFNQRGLWSDDLDIPAFPKRELRLLR
jgi:hypothetical protein